MIGVRHLITRTRWLWPALLALCVLAKPMLDLVGEMHRDLHAIAHVEAAHAPGGSMDDSAEADEHAPPQGWHALMHIDQCCSASTLPTFGFAALSPPPPAFASHDWPLRVPSHPRNDLLRPPIAG